MKQLITTICILFGFLSAINGQDKLNIEFSKKAGKYAEKIDIVLSADLGTKIYYTTDGTRPTSTSERYKRAIQIKSTTVLRAIAYSGRTKGRIFTESYFIEEKTNYPIVSIAIAPEIFFDKVTGWFNPGPNAEKEYPYKNANFWSRREVGANIEIFETDGEQVFNSRAGIRLFGGMSRVFPQKSLAIACREAYGENRIRHQIFPNKKQNSFKHLVLRNAGSDWGKTHARDAIITGLLDDVDVSKQAYRPAILYINGLYWGIYNIREKINRHYLAYEFGVDKDSLDLVEHERNVKVGGIGHYDDLRKFMANSDLSIQENYEYVKSQMDVDNFMIYQITQIFIDNQDGGGNIKFWRPRTQNGRWRWILYDTDWGFSLHEEDAYLNNSLAFHTEPNGPNWPNPPWSTFLLRQLLTNEDFKKEFILKFSDYLNTIFETQNVVNNINASKELLKPEIKRHIKKWRLDYKNWQKHHERMKAFASNRPDYMRNFLQEMFSSGDLVSVKVEVGNGGFINLNNNIDYKKTIFLGQYFNDLPITIRAIPQRGFTFSHWEGAGAVVTDKSLTLNLDKNSYSLKAIFKPAKTDLGEQIIINEISANNQLTGDWVEIYNNTDETVDLTDWVFRDSRNDFIIPNGKIEAKGYTVLCQSANAFKKAFPDKQNVIGDFAFGLNKTRETLELYSVSNAMIDSVVYDLSKMKSAFTLSLKSPEMENSLLANWDLMMGTGTPDAANPSYVTILEVQKKEQKSLFTYIGLAVLLLVSLGLFAWFRKR